MNELCAVCGKTYAQPVLLSSHRWCAECTRALTYVIRNSDGDVVSVDDLSNKMSLIGRRVARQIGEPVPSALIAVTLVESGRRA